MTDDLIAQKRVMSELNISRASLWRARNSGIKTFPAPTIVRARVYWRRTDLPALRAALAQFRGRAVFEQSRRHAKAIAARAEVAGLRTRVRRLRIPIFLPRARLLRRRKRVAAASQRGIAPIEAPPTYGANIAHSFESADPI